MIVPLFDGFDDRFLAVDGATVHCRVGGQGPPVLLLHGYPQTLAMWAPVAAALSSRYTVVCADLRGYGDSSKPASAPDHSTYSFRAMATDQVQLMSRLGFDRFHLVGHDRGARCAHRAALDFPDAILSLTLLDIVPTHTMVTDVDHAMATGYWHWYFLSLPHPVPETLIGADPDFFFGASVATWGAGSVDEFPAQQLSEYRRCWSDPEMIRASCEDYRAALTIDVEHDAADLRRTTRCPTLAVWGSRGLIARRHHITDVWAPRCSRLETAAIDGGHFFVDQNPTTTTRLLFEHLARTAQRPI